MKKKRIICWGDSITVGMGMKKEETYPSVLQKFLNEDFEVINAGGGGENAYTIAARQGAYSVKTSREIVFGELEDKVDITVDKFYMSFCLDSGELLNISTHPNPFSPIEFESETVFIDDEEYRLLKNGKDYLLIRANSSKQKIIPKGANVEFLSAKEHKKGSYCEIFYIGTNGRVSGVPTQKDIETLINHYKKMIETHGDDCYLVLIPYWNEHYTKDFIEEFGEKAVDFRMEAVERGLEKNGLVATESDIEKMSEGIIPPSLRYKNNPNDIHLNKYGYFLMAEMLYERGKKLGYWE